MGLAQAALQLRELQQRLLADRLRPFERLHQVLLQARVAEVVGPREELGVLRVRSEVHARPEAAVQQVAVAFDRRLLRRELAVVQVDQGAGQVRALGGRRHQSAQPFPVPLERAPEPRLLRVAAFAKVPVLLRVLDGRERPSVRRAEPQVQLQVVAAAHDRVLEEPELGDERPPRDPRRAGDAANAACGGVALSPAGHHGLANAGERTTLRNSGRKVDGRVRGGLGGDIVDARL